MSGKTAEGAPSDGARKVVLAALAGNLAIAVTKFVAWGFTRSSAMLTEGIHSLVDTADQLLLLVGQKRAARAPNAHHPFGYGMETYFWSFIVALMIFFAGGAAAVWQGIGKILHPEPMTRPLVSFAVLGASALFEALSFRTAYREYLTMVRGRQVRLVTFLKGSKDPNVFATLLEDGAALIGLGIAAVGIALSTFLHLTWADGAASVLIGLLLITVAAFLSNETRSLIAGESAAAPIEAAVRKALRESKGSGEVTRVRTLHLGPETILVAVGWRFTGLSSIDAAERELGRLARCVRAADPRIAEVLFDVAPREASERVSSKRCSSAADTARSHRPAPPRARPG